MPDPWLFDTSALIVELDRARALVLAIPLHNDTFGPTPPTTLRHPHAGRKTIVGADPRNPAEAPNIRARKRVA